MLSKLLGWLKPRGSVDPFASARAVEDALWPAEGGVAAALVPPVDMRTLKDMEDGLKEALSANLATSFRSADSVPVPDIVETYRADAKSQRERLAVRMTEIDARIRDLNIERSQVAQVLSALDLAITRLSKETMPILEGRVTLTQRGARAMAAREAGVDTPVSTDTVPERTEQ